MKQLCFVPVVPLMPNEPLLRHFGQDSLGRDAHVLPLSLMTYSRSQRAWYQGAAGVLYQDVFIHPFALHASWEQALRFLMEIRHANV